MTSVLAIPRRFNGPPSSGNGGWSAGAFAAAAGLPDGSTVRLRVPPPLETPLHVAEAGDTVELRDDDTVVAVGSSPAVSWSAVTPVDPGTARSASSRYPGLVRHPFPTCFSCGPARAEGDGLRIFPGRVAKGVVAAPWTPDPSVAGDDGVVAVPVTWAALDCAGGWSSNLEERPLVLGQISVCVGSPLLTGTPYVVVGRLVGSEGRKTWTSSALLAADGSVLAQAEHIWVAVEWATG